MVFVILQTKQCTVAKRLFAVGTLSLLMEPLSSRIGQFLPQLLPLFLQAFTDEDPQVRYNAFYGIGEMVVHGKESLYPYPFLHDVMNVLLNIW
jgi:vesicle coat complex subunit